MKPRYRIMSKEMVFEITRPLGESEAHTISTTLWSGSVFPDAEATEAILEGQKSVRLASYGRPIEAGRRSPLPVGDEIYIQKKRRLMGWQTIQSLRANNH